MKKSQELLNSRKSEIIQQVKEYLDDATPKEVENFLVTLVTRKLRQESRKAQRGRQPNLTPYLVCLPDRKSFWVRGHVTMAKFLDTTTQNLYRLFRTRNIVDREFEVNGTSFSDSGALVKEPTPEQIETWDLKPEEGVPPGLVALPGRRGTRKADHPYAEPIARIDLSRIRGPRIVVPDEVPRRKSARARKA